ncbi:uncharacterized protein LOC116618336 isoform X1 [Nematostella vectensis]|uniref:uncharacterized protein LOC116618336 isoform X1 n=1 Tax=Nematostella vectensis TaxID=45351 RepID=UPI00139068D9|nr:uncharacterized protein LOC116618336 isoform X1 [Nematostella vectensis]
MTIIVSVLLYNPLRDCGLHFSLTRFLTRLQQPNLQPNRSNGVQEITCYPGRLLRPRGVRPVYRGPRSQVGKGVRRKPRKTRAYDEGIHQTPRGTQEEERILDELTG